MQRERDWEREMEICHVLFHSLVGYNSWDWARLKPRARSVFSVLWMAGAQSLSPSSTALPRPFGGSWIESGAAGTGTGIHVCAGIAGGSTCHATRLAPGRWHLFPVLSLGPHSSFCLFSGCLAHQKCWIGIPLDKLWLLMLATPTAFYIINLEPKLTCMGSGRIIAH